MTPKSKRRSAASEVLHKTESPSKVVLSGDSSVLTPDRETKTKKIPKLTRAKAASIRRAIETKTPVASKREKVACAHGVIGSLSFATGQLAGKTSALFGVIKNAVKKI